MDKEELMDRQKAMIQLLEKQNTILEEIGNLVDSYREKVHK